MQGLLNWQAIRELKFAPMTRDGAGGSAVNWDEMPRCITAWPSLKNVARKF